MIAASLTAAHAEQTIRFATESEGLVSLNIYRADGTLARRLIESRQFPAGEHEVDWDAKADDGSPVGPGEYTWRGISHAGLGLKLNGWVANGTAPPWPTPDGKGEWGGDVGVPSAVAADAEKVYLGWSLADRNFAIVACDLEGRVQWGFRRAEGRSGCAALAVDDGVLYVLGGLEGTAAESGAIYRLDTKDGKPVPWPNGKLDLKITSLWPDNSEAKPAKADGFAVRHGRIYLSFTRSQFLTVLDAKTGAYLQTVVGAPPGPLDVAQTQTELPGAPGKLSDADFAVMALPGGVLGKILFAHDPLWVVTSEMSPMDREVRINALTVIGDGARFHQHHAFIGLGAPFHRVEARPLLDTGRLVWSAGQSGGRPSVGPWNREAMRNIRAVALAADGRLWVAEGDDFPKRFSVWDTSGGQGRLVREWFGSASGGSAINPFEPDLMVAQNCEWRLDFKSGEARCLGVVTREPFGEARFGVGDNGHSYLVTCPERGAAHIFERVGEGDYKLRSRIFCADANGAPCTGEAANQATQTILWADANGDGELQPAELRHLARALNTGIHATQDLHLYGDGWKLIIDGWSACDAPLYGHASGGKAVQAGVESVDGRMLLSFQASASPTGSQVVECRERATDRRIWSWESFQSSTMGSAVRGPEALGNLWPVWDGENGDIQLINEDGFVLTLPAGSGGTAGKAWPSRAVAGMSIPHLPEHTVPRSICQAADGKLYLTSGVTSDWHVEITGLDRVQPLAGGKLTVHTTR